jgi:hypothetical protein
MPLLAKVYIKLIPPARFERAACGLGNRRSIHLSYGGITANATIGNRLEQVKLKLNCSSFLGFFDGRNFTKYSIKPKLYLTKCPTNITFIIDN